VDYEGGVRVEVALSAEMTDLRSGKTVWTNAASETEPVKVSTINRVSTEDVISGGSNCSSLLIAMSLSASESFNDA
jgi:hypothetical protein